LKPIRRCASGSQLGRVASRMPMSAFWKNIGARSE
jgi:hypothetical protein